MLREYVSSPHFFILNHLFLYMYLSFLRYSFLQVSLIEFVAPWMSVSSFSLGLEFRYGNIL